MRVSRITPAKLTNQLAMSNVRAPTGARRKGIVKLTTHAVMPSGRKCREVERGE